MHIDLSIYAEVMFKRPGYGVNELPGFAKEQVTTKWPFTLVSLHQ